MKEDKKLLDKDGNEVTRERIEEVMRELFIDIKPMVQRCEWEEEGILYHSWKIDAGNGRIAYTNDAGVEQLNEAIKQEIMKNYGKEEE